MAWNLALSCFLFLFHFPAAESQNVTFDPRPMNVTVLEGGTAKFTCVVKVDDVQGLVVWTIQPIAAAVAFPRLDNATNLTGASGLYQSPDRTQIIITGIQTSLHLASVSCRGTNAFANISQVIAGDVFIHVLSPPSEPQQLTLFASSAFSTGVSWEPPSDNGRSTEALTYTVTLTNITDGTVLQFNLTTTQITLTNLLPGVQYNVSVYAQHTLASGPPVAEVFRTNCSVPIIEQVFIEYNNELNLRVSVTLGTNGGKPATNYYVTLNGSTTTYPSSGGGNKTGVSFELSGLMLPGGQVFPLSIRVENELGNSTQVDTAVVILGPTSAGEGTNVMDVVTVPVLSAVVGILTVILIASIAVIVIVTVSGCVHLKRKNTDAEEIPLPLPYESPVELKDVHRKNSEEQERVVDPILLPNPAYEPVTEYEPNYL